MAVEKRIKKFSNIDDVLLSPGSAMIYMEELRTQIYHTQKKLRKQRHRLALELSVKDSVNAGFKHIEKILTPEQSEKLNEVLYEAAISSAKKRGLIKE